ncbi:hypothetical protein IQ07DRAFT_642425 [Pyrenochaeta sp. DS3sAY3a]|nr:hypothetical protein IQ07DRAFT_642425 [Pyrenochaeta sp. DS3sAY3a]
MDEIPRPDVDAFAIFVQNNLYGLIYPLAIIAASRLGILPLDLSGKLTQDHELQRQLPHRSLISSDLENNDTRTTPFPPILADLGKIQHTVNETKFPSSPNVPWSHIFGFPNIICYSPGIAAVGAQTIQGLKVASAIPEAIDNLTAWTVTTYPLGILSLVYLLSTFGIIFYSRRRKAPATPEIPPDNTEHQSLIAQLQREPNVAIKDRDGFQKTLEKYQSSAAKQTEELKRELRDAESEIERLNGAHSEHIAECLSRSCADSHNRIVAEKVAESAKNRLAQERAERQSLVDKATLPVKEEMEGLRKKLNAATEKALQDAANAADKTAELIKSVDELRSQLALSQKDLTGAYQIVESLTKVKYDLNKKLKDSNEQNEASAADKLNLEKKIQEYATKQQNLEEEFDSAREQHGTIVADLEGKLENVQKQLFEIVAENHSLRAKNSALETENHLRFQLKGNSVPIEPSYEQVTHELANARDEILHIRYRYTELIDLLNRVFQGTGDSKETEDIEETKKRLDQQIQELVGRLKRWTITEGAPQYQPDEKPKERLVLGPAKLIIEPDALKALGAAKNPKGSKGSSTSKSLKSPTEVPDTNPLDKPEDAPDALEANASEAPAFADPSTTQLTVSLVQTWPGISPYIQNSLIAPPNTPITHDPLASDFFLKWATHPDRNATGVVEMLLPFEDPHYDDMTIPEPYDEEPDPVTADDAGNPEQAECSTCFKWYDDLDHECHKPLCLAFFVVAVRCTTLGKSYLRNDAFAEWHETVCSDERCQAVRGRGMKREDESQAAFVPLKRARRKYILK